ncbi:MAG: hypothetical protein ACKVTZ_06075, partial [Bacteroidia bacterium]
MDILKQINEKIERLELQKDGANERLQKAFLDKWEAESKLIWKATYQINWWKAIKAEPTRIQEYIDRFEENLLLCDTSTSTNELANIAERWKYECM